MPDRTSAEALHDAMPRYIAERDHIMATVRALVDWWGPIREDMLAAYQQMDDENRKVIETLEHLWRMGPEDAGTI
jgi:hypothetical protein